MNQQADSEINAIRRLVQEIKNSWLSKRYDEIGNSLAADVVLAPPGSTERITGREAYIQSYREYDRTAKTHQFKAETPQIDVIGEVAVAVCPFYIEYEFEGKTYKEHGKDLLILRRFAEGWRIVWRTMQTGSASA